jgi:hypothetical protein
MPLVRTHHLHPATAAALWSHFETGRASALAALLCKEVRRGLTRPYDSFAGHVLEDDWRDFALQSVREYLMPRAGHVYVVANPVNAGLYKVGQTKNDVRKRLKSLNSAGVVGYFLEVSSRQVQDRFWVEAHAQRALAAVAQQHKEFFKCSYEQAMTAVEDAANRDAEHNTILLQG